MITTFGGGGLGGGNGRVGGGGSGSDSTGDGGRSARRDPAFGDSPSLDGIHDASGSSSWLCAAFVSSGGFLWYEACGRSRSRACATAVDRERPSTSVLLLGELLLLRPLGESSLMLRTTMVTLVAGARATGARAL